jgi:hypothetical protein
MSLAWIPKGILEAYKVSLYHFIWSGDRENKGMVLVCLGKILLSKIPRWMGDKKLFLFSKSLQVKKIWRLL